MRSIVIAILIIAAFVLIVGHGGTHTGTFVPTVRLDITQVVDLRGAP